VDCTLIQGHLIGYHFATLTDDERASVEGHLVECGACLRTYLGIKSFVERGAPHDELPREAARLRLRAAVEARFRPTPRRRVTRWLRRPVPLYQGLAAVAVVAAAAVLAPALAHVVQRHVDARSAERVDSARPIAESLTIY
jgi:hypothetical protein